MKSHTYDFETQDLVRLLVWPLAPVAIFAGLIHLGAVLHLLPGPRPTLDVDRTILVHKVEAARTKQAAEIVLLGDSSCLMDVSARQLGAQLGRAVLNLGTLSYLDLKADADLLRAYSGANPGTARAVVLLLHPEALRRVGPEAYYVGFLHSLLHNQDPPPESGLRGQILRLLGLDIFQNRILCRWLPAPLHGSYGRAYGFSRDLDNVLTENHGSLVEPEPRPFQGNAEYRLAPQLEAASAAFRQAVPPGAKLMVGIAPVPAGFAGPAYPALRQQMLRQWGRWLQADVILDQLPAVLPDGAFAKTTHLTEAGARTYTEMLAGVLKSHLR